MAASEECRVFVGGLSWDTTDKRLEQAFRRFGKVLDAQVMLDRDTGRPRGFGFVTFADEQGMKDAISGLHNGELDGRIICVNRAQPQQISSGGRGYVYEDDEGNGHSNDNGRGRSGGVADGGGVFQRGGGRGGERRGGRGGGRSGGGGGGGGGGDECFKCGKLGHWARECPLGDGARDGGRFPPPRYSAGRNERYIAPPHHMNGEDMDRYGDDMDRYGSGSGGSYGSGARYGSGVGQYSDGGLGRVRARGSDAANNGGNGGGRGGPRFSRGFRDRPSPYSRPNAYNDRY